MGRITWLERDQFFAIAELRPRTVREWQYFTFSVSDAIYSDIPSPHAENPDDESFPSPVRRWYGRIDDRLFVSDVFYDFSPNECQIRIPYGDSNEFAWQTLYDLQMLPASIQTHHSLGISNDSESRMLTVYRRDDRGFDYPIYDGASDADAESLIQFLRSQNSAIIYSLGNPETELNWVAIEVVGDSHILRACYNCRTSALCVGCELSKKSENEYFVYSESPECDARRYAIRNGIVREPG